jgi:hypothetical protein
MCGAVLLSLASKKIIKKHSCHARNRITINRRACEGNPKAPKADSSAGKPSLGVSFQLVKPENVEIQNLCR